MSYNRSLSDPITDKFSQPDYRWLTFVMRALSVLMTYPVFHAVTV